MSKVQEEIENDVAAVQERPTNTIDTPLQRRVDYSPDRGAVHAAFWTIIVMILLCVAVALSLRASSGTGVQSSSASSGPVAATSVVVLQMNTYGFLQTSVTLHRGEHLLLVSSSAEEHVLYNGTWSNGSPRIQREPGAPLINDMILREDTVSIGPFNTAGVYHIISLLHKGVQLTVIVQ